MSEREQEEALIYFSSPASFPHLILLIQDYITSPIKFSVNHLTKRTATFPQSNITQKRSLYRILDLFIFLLDLFIKAVPQSYPTTRNTQTLQSGLNIPCFQIKFPLKLYSDSRSTNIFEYCFMNYLSCPKLYHVAKF